jgi:hypothetical protein
MRLDEVCLATVTHLDGSTEIVPYATLALAIRSEDRFNWPAIPSARRGQGRPLHLDPTSETYRCA